MDKKRFAEHQKIACFRSITNQLYARQLITDDEYERIMKHIEKMERALIGVKPQNLGHSRKLTQTK